MPQKKILKIENDSIDFSILAVVSAEKDYRLCHYINKELHFNLARQEPLTLPTSPPDTIYNMYEHTEGLTDIYFLVNKNNGQFLIPEIKLADYIMLFRGNEQDELAELTKQKLQTLPLIQTIFAVDNRSVKSKNLYYID